MKTLLGAGLWTLFLLLTLFLLGKEERRRLAQYRGLVRLISHIKAALAASPKPLPAIYAAFRDDALARAGFLPILENEGLAAALDADVLHLDEGDILPFRTYAESLGRRLYAEELRAAEELFSSSSLTLKEKETALPRKEKLTGTLFFSGGMLLLLLLL